SLESAAGRSPRRPRVKFPWSRFAAPSPAASGLNGVSFNPLAAGEGAANRLLVRRHPAGVNGLAVLPAGEEDVVVVGRAAADPLADAAHGAVGHAELYDAGVLAGEVERAAVGRGRRRAAAGQRPPGGGDGADAHPARRVLPRAGVGVAEVLAEQQGVA